MATIEEVIERVKSYNKHSNADLIMKAYEYAEGFHHGQLR